MTNPFDPFAGGVQQTTFKLGRYFHEQKHEVYYFSMAKEGHKVCDYGTLHTAADSGGQSSISNNRQLTDLIKCYQPDVVINQMPYEEKMRNTLSQARDKYQFLLLGCLRNALFSVKNNLTDYAKAKIPSTIKCMSTNALVQNILLKLHKIKHAKDLCAILDAHDYFILLTPSNRMELEWFVGRYKQEKVKVIPNSIPTVLSSKNKFPLKILHVGRLNMKQKRSELLIPLWEKLLHQLTEWEFIIVGDGPYRKKMQEEIDRKSLERIHLVGYADPEPFYYDSTIFVMTSSFEGFPNVLIEAQSYGLVPFAFDSYPALSDILTNDKNGFLVEAFDIDEMSKKIIEYANDDISIRRLSGASLINANKYTTNKVGEKWIQLFKREF